MTETWHYQLRIYLTDEMAALARTDPSGPALRALMDVLAKHDAKPVSQFDAFAAYVREAEQEGVARYPLYKWTKATIDDPAKQARHAGTFSLHVGGQEVYPKAAADALEAALQPLIGGGVVTRMSRHDTNPANNLQVPAEYRS